MEGNVRWRPAINHELLLSSSSPYRNRSSISTLFRRHDVLLIELESCVSSRRTAKMEAKGLDSINSIARIALIAFRENTTDTRTDVSRLVTDAARRNPPILSNDGSSRRVHRTDIPLVFVCPPPSHNYQSLKFDGHRAKHDTG